MSNSKLIFSTASLLFAVLFSIPFSKTGAHGLETTVSELVGKYLVQLEYDTIGNIEADEATSYSFELLDSNTKEIVNFDRVFVRIAKKEGPLAYVGNQYALNVSGIIGVRSRIVLPVEGEYEFNLQYFKGEEKLAEHTFTLPVDPPYRGNSEDGKIPYLWAITLVGGLIVGIAYGKTLNASKE